VVGSGSGRLGPDPNPGLKKLPYLNFFGMCKIYKYFRNLCLTFWIMNIQYFLEHIFIKKISGKKLVKNLYRSGPKTGSRRFGKSDSDLVKNCPDPQHCISTNGIWQVNLMKNELLQFVTFLQNIYSMPNLSFGAVGAGASSHYGSGSLKKMQLQLHNTSQLGNF
jgi:hypothetical protein